MIQMVYEAIISAKMERDVSSVVLVLDLKRICMYVLIIHNFCNAFKEMTSVSV